MTVEGVTQRPPKEYEEQEGLVGLTAGSITPLSAESYVAAPTPSKSGRKSWQQVETDDFFNRAMARAQAGDAAEAAMHQRWCDICGLSEDQCRSIARNTGHTHGFSA